MIDEKWSWNQPENSETSPNFILDCEGNKIFYYNQYLDNTLKERKLGHLIGISPDGEEIWEFVFPDYSYLYFEGDLILKDNLIFVLVNSSREFDSGFERGIYTFGLNGEYVCNMRKESELNSSIRDRNKLKNIKC